MKRKFDWFPVGMLAAVLLAVLIPEPGSRGGWLHASIVNKVGVALIFFLNGVSLSPQSLRAGTLRWPLHVVVQLCTFLFFPLLGWALFSPVERGFGANLAIGFFFLCALPSTVSSSVALTSAARGNVPAAVFNATLSSFIGVFITPLWVAWVLGRGGGAQLSAWPVIVDLCRWLLTPFIAGQLLRPWLSDWAKRNKPWLFLVDRGTILFIIHTSFCDSIVDGVWRSESIGTVLGGVVGSALVFGVVAWCVNFVSLRLHFPIEDRITAVFCGSKKTIASGVPMAQLIFAGDPRLGVILLPLMIYHPLQLLACGVLAGKWAKRSEANS